MDENKDIRGLLQTEFEHFEADPGVDLWPAIEAELRPRKKKIAVWWSYTIAAASIVILFGSLFWLLNQDPEEQLNEEPRIAEIDSVWKEKLPEEHFQTDEQTMTAENKEDDQEEIIDENIKTPVLASGSNNKKLKKNFADRAVDMPEDNQQKVRKALKDSEMNISQIAMQTMGPGLSPMTEGMERLDAPEIPKKKKVKPDNFDQNDIKRLNTDRQFASNKTSIDLNNLTAENAVSFVSNGLSKLKNSPVDFYEERGPDGELKVYQLDFLNLKITKKTRKTPLKKL